MAFRSIPVLRVLVLLLAAAAGCTAARRWQPLNQSPTVTLTAAPSGVADTAWYAYDLQWAGADPDGSIARFDYAIDAPTGAGVDTPWVATTKTHEVIHFRATEPYHDPVHGWRSSGFHTFAIRAVDDAGAFSPVVSRAFYSYTIAPTVRITKPLPDPLLSRVVPTNVRIEWEGHDEDGVATHFPVKYRHRLLTAGDPEFDPGLALQRPDSLRAFYAARRFAGWDSVGADTTFAQFNGLVPNTAYVFVVVAEDEAGAYSPEFSLATNMLMFTPQPANLIGPVLTVWCGYFSYTAPAGDSSPSVSATVPAGTEITFSWLASPSSGARIVETSWRLDDGPAHVAPPEAPHATLGPFPAGESHFLAIGARDDLGLSALLLVSFATVALTAEHELLVVDDTRLKPDQIASGDALVGYGNSPWPAAAELDTFLYARGGFPWRLPGPAGQNVAVSPPGVFAGYDFDTLGTRTGLRDPSEAVSISRLAHYAHVLWITDRVGATTLYEPASPVDPISCLRWMCDEGRANTLAVYAAMGGQVWLAGGTAGLCTAGSRNRILNDGRYPGSGTVLANADGELVAGTMPFDFAGWRSEFVTAQTTSTPRRSEAAVGGWSHPGWGGAGEVAAPDYARLPAALRRRAIALGDSLPPTCLGNTARFYSTAVGPPFEYLTLPNAVAEDFDPDAAVVDLRAALDTLYELQGGTLATSATGQRPATMTYYHGLVHPKFVFTGFDLWTWSRQDVVGLVDFVLQEIWGMPRTGAPVRPALRPAASRSGDGPGSPMPGARNGAARRARTAPGRASGTLPS